MDDACKSQRLDRGGRTGVRGTTEWLLIGDLSAREDVRFTHGSAVSEAYYRKRRDSGDSHYQAIRRVERRLVRKVFGCLRDDHRSRAASHNQGDTTASLAGAGLVAAHAGPTNASSHHLAAPL